MELDRSCTERGTTPRGLMQQKGRDSSGLQRQRRMTRIGPGLRLSLGKDLHLNNLNRLEDIEPLDLHWRSTRLRDLIGADRSEQIEHNRGIRTL